MFSLEWPLALLALPLPWLVRQLPPARGTPGSGVRLPFLDLDTVTAQARRRRRWPSLAMVLAVFAWALLVLAASRPQWLGEPVTVNQSGRDLMLAVDLSRSMAQEDFDLQGRQVDRLDVIKRVAGEFIDRREGDRIGLILFGTRAYLQSPLTFDRVTVKRFLQEAEIQLAGRKTAIGDAIGLGIKRMRAAEAGDQQVIILLTDGTNTAGSIEPLAAASAAARAGIRIYTIGVGSEPESGSAPFGLPRMPAQDLDEESLEQIASRTGGRYFRARDTRELAAIYGLLDGLEPVADDEILYRPMTPLYPWPLGAAFALSLALALRIGVRGR